MDSHSFNEFFWYVVGAFATLIFWAFRYLNSRMSANERETAALALHVAEEYVSVKRFDGYIERFDKAVDAIFKKLDNVSDKLDKKADKPQ